jgi:hypothetical protein
MEKEQNILNRFLKHLKALTASTLPIRYNPYQSLLPSLPLLEQVEHSELGTMQVQIGRRRWLTTNINKHRGTYHEPCHNLVITLSSSPTWTNGTATLGAQIYSNISQLISIALSTTISVNDVHYTVLYSSIHHYNRSLGQSDRVDLIFPFREDDICGKREHARAIL